jgi:hypothetical protein
MEHVHLDANPLSLPTGDVPAASSIAYTASATWPFLLQRLQQSGALSSSRVPFFDSARPGTERLPL